MATEESNCVNSWGPSVVSINDGHATLSKLKRGRLDDIGWGDFGYNNGTASTPSCARTSRRATCGHYQGQICDTRTETHLILIAHVVWPRWRLCGCASLVATCTAGAWLLLQTARYLCRLSITKLTLQFRRAYHWMLAGPWPRAFGRSGAIRCCRARMRKLWWGSSSGCCPDSASS